MGQQLGAEGAFQPILHGDIRRVGEVDFPVCPHGHRRRAGEGLAVDLRHHRLHGHAPLVVAHPAELAAVGLDRRHPKGAVRRKGKVCDLAACHVQYLVHPTAIWLHPHQNACLGQLCRRIEPAILHPDGRADLIGAQIQRVGGIRAPHVLGALRSLRGGIGLWRRVDGPEHQRVHQRHGRQRRKHVAGRPEPVEQGFPLNGHLGLRLGLAAGCQLARRSQRSTNRATWGPTVTDAMNNIKRNSTSPMRISFFPLQRELIYQISITQTFCSRNCFAFSSVVYYSKTRVFQRLHANFTKISNCRIKIKSGLLGPFYKTNKAPFAFEEGDFLWLKF